MCRVRVVKTCLWFRKHNFWSQCGSSKYAGNFAKTPLQIAQIVIYATQNNGPAECQILSANEGCSGMFVMENQS